MSLRGFWAVLVAGQMAALAATVLAAPPVSQKTQPDYFARRTELHESLAADLDELAAWCDSHELAAEAGQVRGLLSRRHLRRTMVFSLDEARRQIQPVSSGAAEASPSAADQFAVRLQVLRKRTANRLYETAESAATANQPAAALQLVTDAAWISPEHKLAWRMLGYVKQGQSWQTAWSARQMAAGKVWSDKFGWLPKSHLLRYERGQRFYRDRWMPAEEETGLRRDMANGWRVETEHYVVTTNDSLEEGVALAAQLERLWSIWQQVFAGYLYDGPSLARLFPKGDPLPAASTRHNVVYFSNRQQYIKALQAAQPQIAITLGIYFDQNRTAYFFAGDKQEAGTVWHEATHQLFQETRRVPTGIGRRDNFWIIEAVACFMESLVEHDDFATLGGPLAGRMPAARQRLLVDRWYVPLAELVALGMQDLQHSADIARLYSESAGLADFLLARYPAATVDYLSAVYRGESGRDLLPQLTRRSFEELDREYREYLQSAEVEPPIRGSENPVDKPAAEVPEKSRELN